MICKYKEMNDLIYSDQLSSKLIPCMECKKKVRFGLMYNVACSNQCYFYHKFICEECNNLKALKK